MYSSQHPILRHRLSCFLLPSGLPPFKVELFAIWVCSPVPTKTHYGFARMPELVIAPRPDVATVTTPLKQIRYPNSKTPNPVHWICTSSIATTSSDFKNKTKRSLSTSPTLKKQHGLSDRMLGLLVCNTNAAGLRQQASVEAGQATLIASSSTDRLKF